LFLESAIRVIIGKSVLFPSKIEFKGSQAMSVSPLGDLLVNMGLITQDDRTTIMRECGRSSQSFAKSIVRLGIIQEKDLPELLIKRAGATKASPEDVRYPTREALNLVDSGLMAKLEILPLKVEMGRLLIAMGDPLDRDTVLQVQFFVRKPVVALVAHFTEIQEAIGRQLGSTFTPSVPAPLDIPGVFSSPKAKR
jgi:type IV pilus assembly protein PilB